MEAATALSLVSKIVSGDWIHDQVAPNFRSALKSKIVANGAASEIQDEERLGSLTLRAYRSINQSAGLSSPNIQIVRPTSNIEKANWQNNLAIIDRAAKFAAVSEALELRLHQVLGTLEALTPELRLTFGRWVSHILPVEDSSFRSASHPHLFGIIALDLTQPPERLIVSLVHEFAHQELFLLNLTDRLVTKSNDFNLVHAPFQKRARPPIGRLHAAHALFRMQQFEKLAGIKASTHHAVLMRETASTFAPGELTEVAKLLVLRAYA